MKEKLDINSLLNQVENKDLIKRYLLLIISLFIYAIAYNMFFVNTGLMLGGSGGIAILLKDFFSPSLTIAALSIISLILSAFLMDKRFTINSIVGSILAPLFVELTKNFAVSFTIPTKDMMLIVICGGVLIGIANGLSSRSGLSTGGVDTIIHIISKKLKISHGNLYAFINGIIIIIGGFVLGYRIALYALIDLYIISILTDKVVLGVSSNKTFFIVTDNIDEVKEYITNTLSKGITVLDAVGGYSNNKQKVLMVVVPTLEFYKVREGILEIDEDAFITITDSYQVYGENKHKKKGVK
ncbi:MAG: YitT family protein [Bacilli bacterium]|nr:YitT family protein [Bacilli bacterium]